jgi:hypothetical protein
MQISITTNFPDIAKRLAGLQQDVANKALASAINKAAALAKTQMQREITSEFAVKAAYVRERLRVTRANANGKFGISASLIGGDGRRRSANVIRFIERFVTLAQQRKRVKAGTGNQLRFKIKRAGGLKIIRGAFIGNKGRTVFIRTTDKRLPIKAVSTIDVASMFNTKRINRKVVAMINARLPDLIDNDIRFFTAKFNT